jgi:hypothetical protein
VNALCAVAVAVESQCDVPRSRFAALGRRRGRENAPRGTNTTGLRAPIAHANTWHHASACASHQPASPSTPPPTPVAQHHRAAADQHGPLFSRQCRVQVLRPDLRPWRAHSRKGHGALRQPLPPAGASIPIQSSSPSPSPSPSPSLPTCHRRHHHHDAFYMQGSGANPQLQQTRDPHTYPDARPAHSPYEKTYHSPIATVYAHQSPLQRPLSQHQHAGGMEAMSHSPVSPSVYQSMNRGAVQPPATTNYARRPSIKDEVRETLCSLSHNMLNEMQAPPPARADPMSLSSIMSAGTDNDPLPKAQPPTIPNPDHQRLSKPSPNPLFVKQEPMPSPAPEMALQDNGILHRAPYQPLQPVSILHPPQHSAQPRELPVPDEAEIEAALAHIETKQMNDLDTSGDPLEHDEWKERSLKRGLEVISGETTKRKVCIKNLSQLRTILTISATKNRHAHPLPRCTRRAPRLL